MRPQTKILNHKVAPRRFPWNEQFHFFSDINDYTVKSARNLRARATRYIHISLLKELILPVMILSLCVGAPIVQASSTTSPTTEFLHSVFMVDADDGWAVGDNGAIIHWNGAQWSNTTSPTGDFLRSVYMVSSDDGWAVATYGAIIHWNGAQWDLVASPVIGNWFSVFMVDSDDGWVVGDGKILQWTGAEWVPEFSAIVLMALLISLTLAAIILAKTVSRKNTKQLLIKI